MAFATDEAVVYQIRQQHRNEEVREVIPADYKGVLGCDRGKSYDAKELRGVKQQKCLGHVTRSLKAEIEADPQNGFAGTLKEELEAAHRLWRVYRAGRVDREWYDREGAELHKRVTLHLIRERVRLHFQNDRSPPGRKRCSEPAADRADRGAPLPREPAAVPVRPCR